MAGRKRKPGGVAGFITDAISDRQKAQVQAQQLEAKAQLAWARENAKMTTTDARERARQEPREERDREIAQGYAEAEAVTRTLQGHLTELRTLLTGTLGEDPFLPWDRFKCPCWSPSSSLRSGLPRSCLHRRRPASCQSR